ATHENRVAPLGYSVGLALDAAENDFIWTDDSGAARTMTNADRTGTAAFAKGSWREGGNRVNLFGLWSETRRGVPGPTDLPSESARRDDRQAFGYLRHTFEPDERLWLDTHVHAGRTWQNYRDTASLTPANDTHRLAAAGFQADAACAPARWLTFQLGAEAAQSRFDGTAIGAAERLNLAGMGQLCLEWLGIAVRPALRLERLRQDRRGDNASDRRTTDVASPKLSVSWTGFAPAAPYAAFGRSFRAPTLNELYWPAGEWTRGNPQLRPEWATGVEAGLRGRHRGASWLLGWYRNSLADLIQWQPDDSFRWRPVNVAEATLTGLEAEFALDIGRFGLDGNVNWCRARASGERLRYRPELSARGRAWLGIGDITRLFSTGVASPDFRLTLGADWSGDRLADPAWPDTLPVRMPAFALFDAGLEIDFPPAAARIALLAGVRNLTDTRAETMRHYPTPGRSWYAELKLGTGRSGS
ncbi:MAG TPA: TonB-dependent receptor, partial [candidate division WOR-3 bacterium]|nr:TonB-dependent receptor [candidate division WOR-3 bacterium]